MPSFKNLEPEELDALVAFLQAERAEPFDSRRPSANKPTQGDDP